MYVRSGSVIYKNPHCAKCNKVDFDIEKLVCDHDCNKRNAGPNYDFPICFSFIINVKKDDCPNKNEIYDPISEKCSKIYCGHLFILKDGECIRNPNITDHLKNISYIDNSCITSFISTDNITLLGDNSIFINTTNKIYKKGNFEVYNTTTLKYCASPYYASFSIIQKYLTLVCLTISLTCLSLHIIIYIVLPRLRNLPGKQLLCLSISLFLAQIFFLTSKKANFNSNFCYVFACWFHYFWLSYFCWMNVMSITIFKAFKSKVYHRSGYSLSKLRIQSIYGWGMPLLIVSLAVLVDMTGILPDYKPDYGFKEACFLRNFKGLVIFVFLPIIAMILENVILFGFTSYEIYKQVGFGFIYLLN